MIRFKYLLTTLLMGGAMHLMLHKAHAQGEEVPEFSRLRIEGAVKVRLHPSDHYATQSANEPGLTLTSTPGTLRLSGHSDGAADVYFKELKSIEISGTSELTGTDSIRMKMLNIEASGAADIWLVLSGSAVTVDASGTSDVRLSGRCDFLMAHGSGASDIKASALYSTEVSATATGTADISINATSRLNAEASGNSDIKFVGTPPNSNFRKTGMGDITRMEAPETYDSKAPTAYATGGLQQGVSHSGDTTRIRLGRHRFLLIDEGEDSRIRVESGNKEKPAYDPMQRRKMKRVWSGFELGVNGFVSPGMDFNMKPGYTALNTKYGRSWFIGLNLPEIDGQIIRNKLAITTGFGIKWTWMELDANNMMRPDTNVLAFTPTGKALKENELNTFNLSVPVMLKFAPGTRKSAKGGFHIAAGVILNYVAATHLKTVTDGGFDTYTRYYSDFNINPFRVDATVRVGYDRLKFFANYSLTPYFDSSKAPDIRTFAAGMTLIGF